jgi:hypothetical protein
MFTCAEEPEPAPDVGEVIWPAVIAARQRGISSAILEAFLQQLRCIEMKINDLVVKAITPEVYRPLARTLMKDRWPTEVRADGLVDRSR